MAPPPRCTWTGDSPPPHMAKSQPWKQACLCLRVNARNVISNGKDCGSVQGHSQHEATMLGLEPSVPRGQGGQHVSGAFGGGHPTRSLHEQPCLQPTPWNLPESLPWNWQSWSPWIGRSHLDCSKLRLFSGDKQIPRTGTALNWKLQICVHRNTSPLVSSVRDSVPKVTAKKEDEPLAWGVPSYEMQ